MSRKRAAAETRTELLDVAWAQISERGAEVSMAEIAKAAGLSRQGLYLHFGTRGGMLFEMVKRADERFRVREDFFGALSTPRPAERLDACLRAWFAFVPKILPVARDLVRLRPVDPDAAAAWEDRMTDLRSWIAELVDTLARDGALAPEWSAPDATDYLWAASSVQTWDLLASDRGWPPDRIEATLRRAIAAALLKRPA